MGDILKEGGREEEEMEEETKRKTWVRTEGLCEQGNMP
jgi:hypothetical protein